MITILVVLIAAAIGLAIALFLQSGTNEKLVVENSKLKNDNSALRVENSTYQTKISILNAQVKNINDICASLENKYGLINAENRKLESELNKFKRPVDPKTGKFLKTKPEPEQKKVVLKKRLEEAFM